MANNQKKRGGGFTDERVEYHVVLIAGKYFKKVQNRGQSIAGRVFA